MRLLQLATLLSLGAGSLAVLIPPSDALHIDGNKHEGAKPSHIQRPKVDTHGLTPEEYAISQLTQTVEIPCESCPFPSGKDGKTFINTPNKLQVTLSLDPNKRDIIKLNDRPMFPVIYAAADPHVYTVTQKSLNYGAEANVPVDIDLFIETDTSGLSRLRLHILAVWGWKTQATMQIVEFPVFQNNAGEVFIGEAHVRDPTPAEASAVLCKDNMFCRWKAYVYDTLHRIAKNIHNNIKGVRKGGCHGKKYKRPGHAQSTEKPKHHKGHKGHKGHHHDDVAAVEQSENKNHKDAPVHKWRWFNWVGLVIRLILACLVIAAITITIGLFFTLIVSTIIHVLVVSWLFVSGKSRGCCKRQQPADDEEEQGLMGKDEESQLEAQEYRDDLPIYSENTEKQ
ncbi:hypothetical protein H072_8482 [Dactylellina haptotyla CBS 200.50]|uniref:Uncharacterized protein n=1 Tax=Dactylellina haptotyla (strain CBS 200.50) TaxID=1284197 RepID=S8BET1_DACHA|nr:hypothetical protein H072_8482 [Dactylellina haptotyla CBS 200.50]